MTNPDLIELAMRMVQGKGTEAVAPNSFAAAATDHAGKMPRANAARTNRR